MSQVPGWGDLWRRFVAMLRVRLSPAVVDPDESPVVTQHEVGAPIMYAPRSKKHELAYYAIEGNNITPVYKRGSES